MQKFTWRGTLRLLVRPSYDVSAKPGYTILVTATHNELGPTDSVTSGVFYEEQRPEYIFICAAQIAGIETCGVFNRQHGARYLSVMPTNLRGRGDNHDLHTSHLRPALLRKRHEAKVDGKPRMRLWGTGSSRCKVLYPKDLADATVFLANLPKEIHAPIVNSKTEEKWSRSWDQFPVDLS